MKDWRTVLILILGFWGWGVVVPSAGAQQESGDGPAESATGSSVEESPAPELEPLHDIPLRSQGELRVFLETACFRGPEGFALLELYSLLDARQLQFVPESGKFVAQIDFSATLTDPDGNQVKRELWTRNVSVEDVNEMKQTGAFVRDVIGFDLPPNVYEVNYAVEDIYGDRRGTCEGKVEVRDFDGDGLEISDLVFASELEPAQKPGRFVRHGWKVIPNTTRGYLLGKPIRVYFEIYNLKLQQDKPKDSFVLGYSLTDSTGFALKKYPPKRILKPGESVVKTEVLETTDLKGGVYYLKVEAFDQTNRQHATNRRVLYVLSDEKPEMSEAEQEQVRYFMDIRHVADSKDLKVYESLNGESARMKFLKAFWRKLDPTPDTPMNERLRDHLLRMKHADIYFAAAAGKDGSETDMGRVYIRYGPPDDHDFTPSASDGRSVDKWFYERSGRYLFVFQERRGHGVFELVHSTMSGELYNPDWESQSF